MHTRFLKKYFQDYNQAVGKFALNYRLTWVKLTGFGKPVPSEETDYIFVMIMLSE